MPWVKIQESGGIIRESPGCLRYILSAGVWTLISYLMVHLPVKDSAAANGQAEFITGQQKYFAGGRAHTVDFALFVENGRTYVPAAYLAEALGASVRWEGAPGTVIFTKEIAEVKLLAG